MDIFNTKNIILSTNITSVQDAITAVGSLLSKNGYVDAEYINAMHKREEVVSTYVGNSVAVPHGIAGSDTLIFQSGISLVRLQTPIVWNGEDEVQLVIGIAGKDGTHMDILGRIAVVCSDEENIKKLLEATSEEEIIRIFEE